MGTARSGPAGAVSHPKTANLHPQENRNYGEFETKEGCKQDFVLCTYANINTHKYMHIYAYICTVSFVF